MKTTHPDPHTAAVIESVDIAIAINRLTDRAVLRDLNHAVIERMRALDRDLVYEYRLGDHVEFTGRRGETVKGIVEKINARTVTVGVDFARKWRVGASLLRKSADNDKVAV